MYSKTHWEICLRSMFWDVPSRESSANKIYSCPHIAKFRLKDKFLNNSWRSEAKKKMRSCSCFVGWGLRLHCMTLELRFRFPPGIRAVGRQVSLTSFKQTWSSFLNGTGSASNVFLPAAFRISTNSIALHMCNVGAQFGFVYNSVTSPTARAWQTFNCFDQCSGC